MRVFHYAKGNEAKSKNKEKAKPKLEVRVKAAKSRKAKFTKNDQATQAVASAVTAKERLLHLLSAQDASDSMHLSAGAGATNHEGAEVVANVENTDKVASEASGANVAMVDQSEIMEFMEAKTTANAASHTATEVNNGLATDDTSVKLGKGSALFYPVVVYTPQDLEAAQAAHAEHIVVKGELAKKLRIALKSLRSLSVSALNALALCVSGAALFAPFTGGVSLGAAGTVMGTVGAALTATAIAAISAIGLSLVLAVLRGYDEIKLAGGGFELHLQKKKATGSEQKCIQSSAQESASVTTATVASSASST